MRVFYRAASDSEYCSCRFHGTINHPSIHPTSQPFLAINLSFETLFAGVLNRKEDTNVLLKLHFVKTTLCDSFSRGGRLSRILLMACSGGSLKYGGSPSTISITMIPKDQISTCAHNRHFIIRRTMNDNRYFVLLQFCVICYPTA